LHSFEEIKDLQVLVQQIPEDWVEGESIIILLLSLYRAICWNVLFTSDVKGKKNKPVVTI